MLDPAVENIQTKQLENTKKRLLMIKCPRSNRCCENQWPTQSIFIFHPAGCGALSSQCTSEAALTTWVIVVCSSLHAALRQGHPPQAVEQGFTSPWNWGRIIVLYSTAQGICSFWKHILTALQIMLVSFFPLSRQCVLWTWLEKVFQSGWFYIY